MLGGVLNVRQYLMLWVVHASALLGTTRRRPASPPLSFHRATLGIFDGCNRKILPDPPTQKPILANRDLPRNIFPPTPC
jgi:hypothetical protein